MSEGSFGLHFVTSMYSNTVYLLANFLIKPPLEIQFNRMHICAQHLITIPLIIFHLAHGCSIIVGCK